MKVLHYHYMILTSMEVLSFPAFSKQLRTDGSILEPPKAATSPSWRGTWMQSCKSSPNLRWSTNRLGSAISRNKSTNKAISLVKRITIQGDTEIAFQNKKSVLWLERVNLTNIRDTSYSHLYFSSKCPLQSKTSPTLKDKTRICPVRWLQGNKIRGIKHYEEHQRTEASFSHNQNATGSPVIDVEQPVYGEVEAEWHINKAGVIGRNQFIKGSEHRHHIRNIN